MNKDKMRAFNSEQDYTSYIETIKNIVKQNEADKKRVDQLQKFTEFEESKLQNHLHHLKHLQEVQHLEFQMWQKKAQELSNKQKELEQIIEQQSKTLALSKAQLEHGLRMIDLMPSSRPSDYLANTGLHKSASENINGDWVKVGEQLARTFFSNIETQK